MMSAGTYVKALMQLGEAVGALNQADQNAWGVACGDLSGKDEESINHYFAAATAALAADGVAANDPRRVALRNHKSVLVGTVRRGVAIIPGLSKNAQAALNQKARAAKNGQSAGESRTTIQKATYNDVFLAFVSKIEEIKETDVREKVIRAAIERLTSMLPKPTAKGGTKR